MSNDVKWPAGEVRLQKLNNSNWREMIGRELRNNGESWSDVISITLTDEELGVRFDGGFGGINGQPFTAWTESYVYFPTEYDGAESVASVPRNPNGKKTEHI